MIKPKDIQSIKSAINKLEDREVRLQMSEWNIKKVEENYTIDNVMNVIFSQYESIMKED